MFPRPTTVALLQRPLWFISGRLVEADGARTDLIHRDQDNFEPALPQGLRDFYDVDLHFHTEPTERPFVIANFVSTLDGQARDSTIRSVRLPLGMHL